MAGEIIEGAHSRWNVMLVRDTHGADMLVEVRATRFDVTAQGVLILFQGSLLTATFAAGQWIGIVPGREAKAE